MMVKAFAIARAPDVGLCDGFSPTDMLIFDYLWDVLSKSLGPSCQSSRNNMRDTYNRMRDL
jgi:hypothetical protein